MTHKESSLEDNAYANEMGKHAEHTDTFCAKSQSFEPTSPMVPRSPFVFFKNKKEGQPKPKQNEH